MSMTWHASGLCIRTLPSTPTAWNISMPRSGKDGSHGAAERWTGRDLEKYQTLACGLDLASPSLNSSVIYSLPEADVATSIFFKPMDHNPGFNGFHNPGNNGDAVAEALWRLAPYIWGKKRREGGDVGGSRILGVWKKVIERDVSQHGSKEMRLLKPLKVRMRRFCGIWK